MPQMRPKRSTHGGHIEADGRRTKCHPVEHVKHAHRDLPQIGLLVDPPHCMQPLEVPLDSFGVSQDEPNKPRRLIGHDDDDGMSVGPNHPSPSSFASQMPRACSRPAHRTRGVRRDAETLHPGRSCRLDPASRIVRIPYVSGAGPLLLAFDARRDRVGISVPHHVGECSPNARRLLSHVARKLAPTRPCRDPSSARARSKSRGFGVIPR